MLTTQRLAFVAHRRICFFLGSFGGSIVSSG
jgi:hypothetical protein